MKAGKGRTVAVVMDELSTVYKIANNASTYNQMTSELEKMPECRD
jgi:hypothetical protein